MGGSHKAPSGYQPTGQGQADIAYQNIVGGQMPYAQALPQQIVGPAYGLAGNIISNPYAAGAQQAAGQVQQIGTQQVAPMDFSNAAGLSQFAGQAPGLANQITQQAFDPQQALYNRTFQRLMDQQNAINSMYGLQNSPYGAGLAGQTASNFNIDWQNQQLQRMLEGAQGYEGLLGAEGGAYGQAGQLGTLGLQDYTAAGLLPWQTYSSQQQQGLDALNAYSGLVGGALQPGMGISSELATYLGLGQSATQNAQNAVRINNAESAGALGGFGNLLGTAAGAFLAA